MPYFDRYRYEGLWYENQRYFTLFEAGGRCMTILHEDAGDGRFAVTNSMVDWFGKRVTVSGFASIIDTKGPVGAKYNLRYYSNPFLALASKGKTDGNYWVLDTDYDNYAIVWSCNDKLFSNTQFLWILTRLRHPDDWVVDRAIWEVERRGLDISELKTTDHTGCPPAFDSYELGYDSWNSIYAPSLSPYTVPPVTGVGYSQPLGNAVVSRPYYDFGVRSKLNEYNSVSQERTAWNQSSVPHTEDSSYLQYTPLPAMNMFQNFTQANMLPKSSYFDTVVAHNSSNALNISPLPATKFSDNRYKKVKVAQERIQVKAGTSSPLQNGWQVTDYHQVLQLRSSQ
ncbi:Lipocalin/cytosolic fatty-acid binding domain [Trinorchestia longiramus]|nr:Lipocalin/cytosolic fatty-acid binding domain [Trinorchestia longiramus]